MIIENSPRQSGKSSRLARLMKLNERTVLVVPVENVKKDFCKRFDISSDRVFTIRQALRADFVPNLNSSQISEIYIDEVGLCLGSLLPKMTYGTHTNDEYLGYDGEIRRKI